MSIYQSNHKRTVRNLLAVHSVSHTTVSRDRVTKVLDVESSLETGSKEAAKGSDQRRKGSHNETVDLEGGVGDGRRGVAELTMKKK